MQHAAKHSTEIAIRDGMGRRAVERSLRLWMIEGEQEQADDIGVMDPAHPLAAAANGSTRAPFEGRQQFRERAALFIEDDADADEGDANAR